MSGVIDKFRRYLRSMSTVLSINQRNLEYIYVYNQRRHYPMADNKLLTKEILAEYGVPQPATYASFSYFYQLKDLNECLSRHEQYVIKPAQGRGGGGIIVITGRNPQGWTGISGDIYTEEDIKQHLSNIIFGIHSFGLKDTAIIEERVIQHTEIAQLCAAGLADVRIVTCQGKPVMAMLRLPSSLSGGRANLHQGALGVGVDLQTGLTSHAMLKGGIHSHHPDTGKNLIGIKVPFWRELMEVATNTARALPLSYLGVDLALGTNGPVVLEVNVRPGIEIQNVNNIGMRAMLRKLEAES